MHLFFKDSSFRVLHTTRLLHTCLAMGMVAFIGVLLAGCSTFRSGEDGIVTYNVELRESGPDIVDRCNPAERLRSIQSQKKPDLIPAKEFTEARYRVYAFPCNGSGAEVVYDIPASKVVRVTETSDPLHPPGKVDSLVPPETCCRDRIGWWFFDKLELRVALHYRGQYDSIFYASATGGTTYHSATFGTGRGGSTFFGWFELAGLWSADWLDQSHRFQLGVLTGVWPVDGSIFVPLTIHPRYTFRQHPEEFTSNCNTWYLFGDAGIPFDFQTGASIIGKSMDRQRSVFGFGVGYDWSWGCARDFSIDLGYRRLHLPLPALDCCPSIPKQDRIPWRTSNALMLRLGVTF